MAAMFITICQGHILKKSLYFSRVMPEQVIVTAKEGLAGTNPAEPSFGMTWTIKCFKHNSIVAVVPNEGLPGLMTCKPVTMTKFYRPVLACHGSFVLCFSKYYTS